jgi:hypothetical protein
MNGLFAEAKLALEFEPVDVLKNIDTSQYEYLDGLTADKVRSQIYKSITLLPCISPDAVHELWSKLTEYRYVYSLNQLRRGRFVRWIAFTGTPYKLSYGGMVVDIEITEECPMILCKTPVGKLVKFDFNANRVYQKLSAEEKLLIVCAEHCQKQ